MEWWSDGAARFSQGAEGKEWQVFGLNVGLVLLRAG